MSPDTITQLVGFAGLLLGVSGFQMRQRRHVLLVIGAANFCWAGHFFLLGACTAAAINIVSLVRNVVFTRYRESFPDARLPIAFVVVFSIAAALTWQGPISLVALMASCAATMAFWQRDTRHTRRWSLLMSPLWFVHNAIQGSWPGMIIELFVTSSVCVAMWRYDRKAVRDTVG